MTEKIINCSKCSGSHFINEFAPVKSGIANYMLCPKCVKELLAHLEGKHFIATMIKTTLPLDEWMRVRDERRKAYTGGDFGFGGGE